MRNRALILLAAIVFGGAAALATFAYLNEVRRDAVTGNQLTEVYVATRDVARGATAEELLSSGAVERVKVPLKYVAAGSFSSVEKVKDRVLAVGLSKGEILTQQRFQFRSEAGLAYTVPKDFVAVTVPVNESRGVAGLLKPGDRVAVIATLDTKTPAGDETRIAVPGARVLAVGRTTDANAPEPGTGKPQQTGTVLASEQNQSTGAPLVTNVTLALSVADAEKVVLAAEAGQVWLALLPSNQGTAGPGSGQTALTVLR